MKFQRQPSFAETGLFQSRMSFRQRADAKKETEVQRHMIPLKTAIADDDRYICQQIQECLMQYSTQKDIDIDDPDIYTDCATLYNTDFTQKRYDLVFMDIDFSGGTEPVKHFSLFDTTRERCDNGIALGAHLRNRLGHNYFDIIYVLSLIHI